MLLLQSNRVLFAEQNRIALPRVKARLEPFRQAFFSEYTEKDWEEKLGKTTVPALGEVWTVPPSSIPLGSVVQKNL